MFVKLPPKEGSTPTVFQLEHIALIQEIDRPLPTDISKTQKSLVVSMAGSASFVIEGWSMQDWDLFFGSVIRTIQLQQGGSVPAIQL